MNQKKISQEYEKAIQYIYELMKSGELTIGSRLPTERALAETLGIDSEMVKPNGMILSYPVITSGEFAHTGSFECLLGEDYNDLDKRKEQSLEFQVSRDTPPTFLWHTVTDDCVPVENSLLFFNALRKLEIPVEMHLYPVGGHGLSLANEETSYEDGGCVQKECQSWMELACKWMQNI